MEECVGGTGTAVVAGEGVCSRIGVRCSRVGQVKGSQEAVDGVGGRMACVGEKATGWAMGRVCPFTRESLACCHRPCVWVVESRVWWYVVVGGVWKEKEVRGGVGLPGRTGWGRGPLWPDGRLPRCRWREGHGYPCGRQYGYYNAGVGSVGVYVWRLNVFCSTLDGVADGFDV